MEVKLVKFDDGQYAVKRRDAYYDFIGKRFRYPKRGVVRAYCKAKKEVALKFFESQNQRAVCKLCHTNLIDRRNDD